MEPKRILVACGTAVTTSAVVARKLEEELGKRSISVTTDQCKARDVPERASDFDLVVSTTEVGEVPDTPVITTVSFLTGIGMEEELEHIVRILNDSGTND